MAHRVHRLGAARRGRLLGAARRRGVAALRRVRRAAGGDRAPVVGRDARRALAAGADRALREGRGERVVLRVHDVLRRVRHARAAPPAVARVGRDADLVGRRGRRDLPRGRAVRSCRPPAGDGARPARGGGVGVRALPRHRGRGGRRGTPRRGGRGAGARRHRGRDVGVLRRAVPDGRALHRLQRRLSARDRGRGRRRATHRRRAARPLRNDARGLDLRGARWPFPASSRSGAPARRAAPISRPCADR